jgi:hypothetical protein
MRFAQSINHKNMKFIDKKLLDETTEKAKQAP